MQEWVLQLYIDGASLVLSSDSCSPGGLNQGKTL